MRFIFVIAGLLFGSSAFADTFPCMGDCMILPNLCFNGNCMISQQPIYDDTPLGKAMVICDRHFKQDVVTTTSPTIVYEKDWQSCFKIRALWETTETARRQREAAEQEKRDLEFVKKIAGEAHE
jgi:hypothetical protein